MMGNLETILRPATPDDASDLVRLVNIAGEGLPFHFWQTIAEEGQDPWDIGMSRALRDEGAFSWRNSTVIEAGSQIASALVAYGIAARTGPPDLSAVPPLFVPLEELELLAASTFYVNVLATYPEFRGRGFGGMLLAEAAKFANGRALSLIVSDSNFAAIRLYERTGFRIVATRPKVKDGWDGGGRNWVLMIKPGSRISGED